MLALFLAYQQRAVEANLPHHLAKDIAVNIYSHAAGLKFIAESLEATNQLLSSIESINGYALLPLVNYQTVVLSENRSKYMLFAWKMKNQAQTAIVAGELAILLTYKYSQSNSWWIPLVIRQQNCSGEILNVATPIIDYSANYKNLFTRLCHKANNLTSLAEYILFIKLD